MIIRIWAHLLSLRRERRKLRTGCMACFVFNYSALVSLGLSAAALSGLKFAAPRVAAGITRQLFADDSEEIFSDFLAYAEEEFVH